MYIRAFFFQYLYRTRYVLLIPPSKPGVQATVTESCVTFSILILTGVSGADVTSNRTVELAKPISFFATHSYGP